MKSTNLTATHFYKLETASHEGVAKIITDGFTLIILCRWGPKLMLKYIPATGLPYIARWSESEIIAKTGISDYHLEIIKATIY